MKTKVICVALAMYSLLMSIGYIVSSSNNDCLSFENSYYREMNKIIINYADSTADTGEFDEFVQSEVGQQYFELNKELGN